MRHSTAKQTQPRWRYPSRRGQWHRTSHCEWIWLEQSSSCFRSTMPLGFELPGSNVRSVSSNCITAYVTSSKPSADRTGRFDLHRFSNMGSWNVYRRCMQFIVLSSFVCHNILLGSERICPSHVSAVVTCLSREVLRGI
jgi:hypothetical protein